MPWTLGPSWSRDDKIAFAKLEGAGFDGQGFLGVKKATIYTVNSDGTGLHQIIDEASSDPIWSPDGNELRLQCLGVFATLQNRPEQWSPNTTDA